MSTTRLRRSLPLVLASVVTLGACAAGGASTPDAPRRDAFRISPEELALEINADLFSVVERLRPRWMRPRADRTFVSETTVSLVVDGIPVANNLSRLREYRVEDVLEVRFLSAANATTQYGTNMSGGAILVVLKRARR